MTLIERLRKVGKDYDFHDNALIYEAADAIEALQAENERLKEAVAEFKKPGEGDSLIGTAARILNVKLIQERDALAAKLVPLEADAERYRWLRKALSDRSSKGKSHHFCSIHEGHPEELDAAIDASKGGQQ